MHSAAKKTSIWMQALALYMVGVSHTALAAPVDVTAPPPSTSGAADTSIETRLSSLETKLQKQNQVIAQQAWLIEEQKRALAQQRAQTTSILIELARLDQSGNAGGSIVPRNANADGTMQGGARTQYAVLQSQPQPPLQSAPAAPGSGGETARPKSEKNVDQLLLDQGGVLLPAGKFQIEPSFDYTAISSDNVNVSGYSIFNAIVIGTIRVDDINRDILSSALTLRYGLNSRVQMDARIPYVYRNDSETTGIGTGDAKTRHIKGHGLGDISVTTSYQPFAARGWRPATILRIQGEFATGKSAFEIPRVAPSERSPERILSAAPTGSGLYTLSPGVNFVWPIDPVVLFAGGSYNYSFKRRFAGFGLVEPGAGFEYYAGLNLSINDVVSVNGSFLNKHRFATKFNGITLPGSASNDARMTLGASIGLSSRVSLVLAASNGLTDESPDYSFSVRLPVSF
jgi:uncharacterized coiled-coil protein SlyX